MKHSDIGFFINEHKGIAYAKDGISGTYYFQSQQDGSGEFTAVTPQELAELDSEALYKLIMRKK